MRNLLRLVSINFTLARYGLDEIILSMHFFLPLHLLRLVLRPPSKLPAM